MSATIERVVRLDSVSDRVFRFLLRDCGERLAADVVQAMGERPDAFYAALERLAHEGLVTRRCDEAGDGPRLWIEPVADAYDIVTKVSPMSGEVQLPAEFEGREQPEVQAFLRKYPDAARVLMDAPPTIHQAFGESVRLRLRVVDAPGERATLFVVLDSALPAAEAAAARRRVQRAWSRAARGQCDDRVACSLD